MGINKKIQVYSYMQGIVLKRTLESIMIEYTSQNEEMDISKVQDLLERADVAEG